MIGYLFLWEQQIREEIISSLKFFFIDEVLK